MSGSFESAVKRFLPKAEIQECGFIEPGPRSKRYRVVIGSVPWSDWQLTKEDAWRRVFLRLPISPAHHGAPDVR